MIGQDLLRWLEDESAELPTTGNIASHTAPRDGANANGASLTVAKKSTVASGVSTTGATSASGKSTSSKLLNVTELSSSDSDDDDNVAAAAESHDEVAASASSPPTDQPVVAHMSSRSDRCNITASSAIPLADVQRAVFRVQEEEMQARRDIEWAWWSEREVTGVLPLMLHLIKLSGDHEAHRYGIIMRNRELIASDLIKELVECNQNQQDENQQVLQMFFQLTGGASGAAAGGSKRRELAAPAAPAAAGGSSLKRIPHHKK